MCTPIGHTLAGGLIGVQKGVMPGRIWIVQFLLVALFANLPDIDFLFGWFSGQPNRYHHGWTHSLGFVVLVGLASWLVAKGLNAARPWKWGLVLGAMVLTHLMLDFFALDTSPPYGIQFFWPVSSGYFISPLAIFPDLYKSAETGTFIKSLFVMHNLRTVLTEILLIGPVTLFFFMVNRRMNS